MLNNHEYNLMRQLVEEHASLWRIKNHYLNDGDDCQDCQDFWKTLETDKESHISELKELVKKHLD